MQMPSQSNRFPSHLQWSSPDTLLSNTATEQYLGEYDVNGIHAGI